MESIKEGSLLQTRAPVYEPATTHHRQYARRYFPRWGTMVRVSRRCYICLTQPHRFGRNNFQDSIRLVNKLDVSDLDWSRFRYVVFDEPNRAGTYAERYSHIGMPLSFSPILNNSHLAAQCLSRRTSKYIELAPYEQCRDSKHLEQFFQDILDKGGEGIILRDPTVLYQPGRSPGYLKHKVRYQQDTLH